MWLHAAADQGKMEAAAAAFEDLQARGAAPNLASFNALFRVRTSLGNDLTCWVQLLGHLIFDTFFQGRH